MRFRRSKTMWFSLFLVILGALMDNFSYLQPLLDPKWYGLLLIAVGIVVAILRFLTTKPLE